MKWRIKGASLETGDDIEIIFDAFSREQAEEMAHHARIAMASIEQITDGQIPPFGLKHHARESPANRAVGMRARNAQRDREAQISRYIKLALIVVVSVIAIMVFIGGISQSFVDQPRRQTRSERLQAEKQAQQWRAENYWKQITTGERIEKGVAFVGSSWKTAGKDRDGVLLTWTVEIRNLTDDTVEFNAIPKWFDQAGNITHVGKVRNLRCRIGQRDVSFPERVDGHELDPTDRLVVGVDRRIAN